MAQFLQIEVNHVLMSENDKADALAKLAASLTVPDEREIQITVGERHLLASALDCFDGTREVNVVSVFEVEEETDWRQPLIEYIQYGLLPGDLNKRVDVKRRALRFTLKNNTLYRKAFEGVLLRCLSREEATYVLNEVHAGVCDAHQASPKLANQIKRLGYYWPTMVQDAMKFAKACQACQIHGDFIHQPPQLLYPSILS